MRRIMVRFGIAVLAILAGAVHADLRALQGTPQVRYQVSNRASLGGTSSGANSINDRDWVAGFSNLPGDESTHATLWPPYASKVDLGTLGGANSNVAWPVKNTTGLIAGIAQTARPDPLGENWSCSAFFPAATGAGPICLGFVWEAGVMTALPTLGGNNGFATGANNRGQVVGWAENTVHEPTCNPPQVLQFRAVVWEPRKGRMRQLPPLTGDLDGSATAINDRGQVVGISGICDNAVGRFSAAHAVLWEDGRVTDLGSLGGVAWNTPMAINQRGDVVGFSNLAGGDPGGFRAHAFLWTRRHGIRDLGTLPGDVYSQALGINERRQVVGLSCTAGFASCRAFLWQDGDMTDLNKLVAPGYPDHLYYANDINARGDIAGQAVKASGESVAFLAVPLHGPDRDESAVLSSPLVAGPPAASAVLPPSVRRMLLQRFGIASAE